MGDEQDRARFTYYGLRRRATTRLDTDRDEEFEPDRAIHYYYDASWRLLERRIDSEYTDDWEDDGSFTSDPGDIETHQYIWGTNYIDELVYYQRDLNHNKNFNDDSSGKHYVLRDRNYSVIGVATGSNIERVRYTPYGESQVQIAADVTGEGTVDVDDFNAILSAIGGTIDGSVAGYTVEADVNRDGIVDIDDLNVYLSAPTSSVPTNTIGYGTENVIGYAGYVFEEELGMYLVRHRWYMPRNGRWATRDPAGYLEGANLFVYTSDSPIGSNDPYGLDSSPSQSEESTETPNTQNPSAAPANPSKPVVVTPNTPFEQCDKAYSACVQSCKLHFPMIPGYSARATFNLCVSSRCKPSKQTCYVSAAGAYLLLLNTSPQCDLYRPTDTHRGANARCFCKCAGNDAWSREVRGCLRALYNKGVSPNKAHSVCYSIASGKGFDRPETRLAYCYASCLESGGKSSNNCRYLCFTGETLIWSSTGLVRIDSMRVGDLVALPTEMLGESLKSATARIEKVHKGNVRNLFRVSVDSEVLFVTAPHPFLAKDGRWIRASDLREGDALLRADGTAGVVICNQQVELEEETTVYTLGVEAPDIFCVGVRGYIVHNK